jgi:hypothetical protein
MVEDFINESKIKQTGHNTIKTTTYKTPTISTGTSSNQTLDRLVTEPCKATSLTANKASFEPKTLDQNWN